MYHRHDEKGLNWEPGGVKSGVVRIIRDLGSNALPAVPDAVAVAVHLQDVDVVGEPVQQRSGEAFRSEDLGPLIEGQIGGYKDGALLVALAEDLEDRLGPGAGQGYKAQFVDDQLFGGLGLRSR